MDNGMTELYEIHREMFGVDPVVTGANAHKGSLFSLIVDAINKGEPYVEPPVPDGTDI